MSAIESPSGKGAGDENFPVASRLIAPRLRGHVMAFYGFARTADDIADSPDLAAEDKVRCLHALGAALTDDGADDPDRTVAHRLRRSLAETGVPARHPLDLLEAFKQDAVQARYAGWADLLAYCDKSANPVGRYLLDLHGEARAAWPQSDALCTALQVLNHLQDCADDHRRLDRVYLPEAWLAEAGTDAAALRAPAASTALRSVLDRCLDGIDGLLPDALALPMQLQDRRLAMEAGAIAELARVLAARLRRQDPVARRVELSKPAKLWIGLRGALAARGASARRRPAAGAAA